MILNYPQMKKYFLVMVVVTVVIISFALIYKNIHLRQLMTKGEWFPWHDIPPNTDVALMMRLRATAWNVIRQNRDLRDSAQELGIVPMSPPPRLSDDRKILFHMIFTSSNNSNLTTFGSNATQSRAFNRRYYDGGR